jgi:hypothetical protein
LVRSIILLVSLTLAATTASASRTAEAIHSRTSGLPPLALSQGDLFSVITRMRSIARASRPDSLRGLPTEKLTIGDGSSEIALTTDFQAADLTAAPQRATDIWYYYSDAHAPVSGVSLRLGHYFRTLVVEGASPEQVDALAAMMTADLTRHRRLGGYGAEVAVRIILFVAAVGMALWATRLQNRLYRVVAWIACPVIYILSLALPLGRILPGTALYPTNASFLARNSGPLTLVGFFISVVPLALSALGRIRRRFRETGKR